MDALEDKEKPWPEPTTPPLFPPEDPEVQKKSPLQPHRRSSNANIFDNDKNEVGAQ